jgi:ribulose-5-phosphate 4-epimerase/fuculose-1-phosphate aldolase
MNPFAKHFSTIKASDLVLVDSEGYVTEGGAQLPINEAGFMIHSEIHKARPDVISAAHTHSIYGKTWSTFGKPIEMLSQGRLFASLFFFFFFFFFLLAIYSAYGIDNLVI